jgi:hypothetical protein
LKPNSPFLSHHALNSDTDFLIDRKNWDNIKMSGEVKMPKGYFEVRLGREEA